MPKKKATPASKSATSKKQKLPFELIAIRETWKEFIYQLELLQTKYDFKLVWNDGDTGDQEWMRLGDKLRLSLEAGEKPQPIPDPKRYEI